MWILVGLALLIVHSLNRLELILYLAVLAVLVWNRIDSRRNGYRITFKTPGGTGLSVETGEGESPKENET
jgi:hypothetical protein